MEYRLEEVNDAMGEGCAVVKLRSLIPSSDTLAIEASGGQRINP